jgi:Protein of unknown function (DUF3618)
MPMLSEQLERAAEQNRVRLAETLDELRERVTPGQVLDQLIDYFGDGAGGEIVRNFGQQVRRNPLSVAVVGAGLAWLMIGNRPSDPAAGRGTRVDNAERKAAARLATLSDRTSAGDGATSAYRRAGEAASDTARRARMSADSAYRSASDAVSEAAHKASDTAATVSRNAAAARRTLADLCNDQPLVLAGLGLALGAALGTALPSTETERRLMGEPGDVVRRRAQELASEVDRPAEPKAAQGRDPQTEAQPASAEHSEASVVPNLT